MADTRFFLYNMQIHLFSRDGSAFFCMPGYIYIAPGKLLLFLLSASFIPISGFPENML